MAVKKRNKLYPSIEFMGIKINTVNYCDIYESISDAISSGYSEYICLTDVGNTVSAAVDEQLKSAINSSLLSLADGAPLAYYARMAGYNRIERISGVTLMQLLFAEGSEFTHYLLGDTHQTINNVVTKARDIYKGIDIRGYSPPFREFTNEDNEDIVEKVNKANPDIVWVCFGGGKQEKWMKNNIGNLKKGIMIGVGSALRWFLGEIKTPPPILQTLCLQWLYRALSELMNNPSKGINFIIERQLLKFPVFLINFPGELARARTLFQCRKSEEISYLSQRCKKCSECQKRINRTL